MLFIHLEQFLKPRKLKKAQLQLLIEETGFKRFAALFSAAALDE
jgi:hypothetical protein